MTECCYQAGCFLIRGRPSEFSRVNGSIIGAGGVAALLKDAYLTELLRSGQTSFLCQRGCLTETLAVLSIKDLLSNVKLSHVLYYCTPNSEVLVLYLSISIVCYF